MKNLLFILTLLVVTGTLKAQDKFLTRTGTVSFFSETPMEDIEATSHQLTAILDKNTGNAVAKVLIKSFEFKKALMQEHFNENYMESEKYPKAVFKGKVVNIKEINFDKDGEYPVKLEGDLTIKGKTKKIKEQGKIVIKDGNPTIHSEFFVKLQDFDIKNDKPNSIANEIKVTVHATLKPYKK